MSEEKLTAKEVIEKIEAADSVQEVEALTEGDDRKTVQEAGKNRLDEIIDENTKALEDLEPDEAKTMDEEDTDGPEEEVETVAVDKELFETVEDAVENVLEFEKSLRGVSNSPRETEGKLEEAAEVLSADPKDVPAEDWGELETAILQHLQYDQQRRGLSTPVPAIVKLQAAYDKLTESES